MISWDLLITQIGSTAVIVAALAWLAKSLFVHGLSRDIETHKAKLRIEVDTAIERLRLHDHDRTEALKRLFQFAKTLENETFPLAEDKRTGFQSTMKKFYWSKLQLDQIYFSGRADEILEHFAEMDVCMRRPELPEETGRELKDFLDKEVFSQAKELARFARTATEAMRSNIQQDHPVDARTSRD